MSKRSMAALGLAVLCGVVAALPAPHLVRDLFAVVALAAVAVASWEVTPGLFLLVAYLPFRVWVQAMVPTPLIFVPDIVTLTVVARLLVLHPDRIERLDTVEILTIVFAFLGLVSTLHAHAHLSGAVLELRDLVLYVVLYAAVRRLMRLGDGPSPEVWNRLVPVAVAAIAVVGLQGILQTFVFGHPFLLPAKMAKSQLHVSAVNVGRPYGWVDNPNAFGELGFLALLLLYGQHNVGAIKRPGLALMAGAFFAAMVVLSFSRTAYLTVLIAAVVLMALASTRMQRLAIGSAVVAMAVAVAVIPGARLRTVGSGAVIVASGTLHHHAHVRTKPPTGRAVRPPHPALPPVRHHITTHRHVQAVIPLLSSTYLQRSERAGRLHNIRVALHIVKHHPLGTGLGTFGSSGSKVFGTNIKGIPKTFYADDNYIVVLVETGLLGTLAFLALGLSVFDRIRRSSAPTQNRILAAVLFLSLIVMAFTGDAFEQLNLTIYPWLALTVLVAGQETASASTPQSRSTARTTTARPA